MSTKPKIVVTRKLPQAVEDRLRRHYDPCFNEQDRLYTSDELIQRAAGADALLICHTEHLSAAVIARLPDSIRAIANFSVGVDHVDRKVRIGPIICIAPFPWTPFLIYLM